MSGSDGYGDRLITATLQETFEPLHTGHSLVFTIAPNGHVWGKRLDNKSGKNDLEITIFAPYLRGVLYRNIGDAPSIHAPVMTKEQQKKVQLILDQKERINYLLGTLMLRSHEVSLVGNYGHWGCSRGKSFERPSISPEGLPYKVVVVDCSYDSVNRYSAAKNWMLSYDQPNFQFGFSAPNALKRSKEGNIWTGCNRDCCFTEEIFYKEYNKDFPRTHSFSAQAENKKFDLRSWNRKTLPPELKIMYDEHNFFDYFEIDDAVLLLEEERLSETESKFYWTVGVAQNKLARNLMRLKSNNPSIFENIG